MTATAMLAVLDCSRCGREVMLSLDENPTETMVAVTCPHCHHLGVVEVDYVYDPALAASEHAA